MERLDGMRGSLRHGTDRQAVLDEFERAGGELSDVPR
jgi:hypothetical protein